MGNIRITEMSKEEKPVERLLSKGAECLTDAELLAVIIRTGTKDENVIRLSEELLHKDMLHPGIISIRFMNKHNLMALSGIGPVKASQILAVSEITKRILQYESKEAVSFDDSKSIADYFMEEMGYLQREHVYALFMNSNHSIIEKCLISEGTINRCMMAPRELFVEALKRDAVCMILLHNHPSGNPEPSDADIQITSKIYQLGKELGISLLDHIVIGNHKYVSLMERGLLYEV